MREMQKVRKKLNKLIRTTFKKECTKVSKDHV